MKQWLTLVKSQMRTSRLTERARAWESLSHNKDYWKCNRSFQDIGGFLLHLFCALWRAKLLPGLHFTIFALFSPPWHHHSSVPIHVSPSLLPCHFSWLLHQLYQYNFQTDEMTVIQMKSEHVLKDLFNSLLKGPARWQSWRGGSLKSCLHYISTAVKMLGKISC